MSPDVRRAMHQALDVVLDALAAEAKGEKVKRKRGPAPSRALPKDVTAEELADLDKALGRAGFRQTG